MERHPAAVVAAAAVGLAALDFAGALAAKRFAEHHHALPIVAGITIFAVLFVVYALALQVAELSIVTMAWVVLLQVSLLAVDVSRHGLRLSVAQWLAAGAVLLLQCYLIGSTA